MEIPVEKKFRILCQIERASHFAWRDAVEQLCPGVKAADVVCRMWEITGQETAGGYLKRIDPHRPLPGQIANNLVFSSVAMGEDARVVAGKDDNEVFVLHNDCPWHDWHRKRGLLEEDRAGCDQWFQTTVREINSALGSKVRIHTEKALPDGDDCCLRRIWIEQD